MTSITEFLEARIAEDEASFADERQGEDGWAVTCPTCGNDTLMQEVTRNGMKSTMTFSDGHYITGSEVRLFQDSLPFSAMALRWQAECKAKRAALARHVIWKIRRDPGWEYALPGVETVCGYCTSERGDRWVPDPCPDVRDLASVYADHPDFDPAWLGLGATRG